MKSWHNVIKYSAIALAVVLIIGIISGIMYVISLLISTFTPDIVGEYKTYEIENDIDNVDIDLHGIDLEVVTATDSNIKVESNYKYLTVKEKGNILLIRDKKSSYLNILGKTTVKLYIPEDMIFEKVEINTGAGKTELENLQANTIDMELGAGKVSLQNIYASDNTFIDAGAGAVIIKDSSFNNLDLKMGVGQFEFSGILSGRNSLRMGVGSSQIDLTGSLDDYKLNIEKGLGEILVDDDIINNNTQLGQGDRELFFEGGIGSIKINFSE
ncbi:MAG: DUF4097 domain-containing protein [Clostridiaceae bacterium]|nr:DUF4097 domain-containing protein [Clostridiaceae bacterium]